MNRYIQTCIICGSIMFLASCSSGGKGKTDHPVEPLKVAQVRVPQSDVLTLKSYYLADSYRDTADWLYGYNYKSHALDIFNLTAGTAVSRIALQTEGRWAVARPVSGLHVCGRDSVWVFDATLKALLLNSRGEVLRSVPLASGLKNGQAVMVERNYAMSTAEFCYDPVRRSLLYGVSEPGNVSVPFRVREVQLDSLSVTEYPLQLSVEVPDVAGGDYANMSRPNLTFAPGKIIYNYPVESHVYVLDLASGQTTVYEAASRFTANRAGKCASLSDYAQWERHGVENPHFYELMHLPAIGKYVRLHVGGQPFDATRDLGTLLAGRKVCLTLFDADFRVLGESELPTGRYSLYTGWCATADALVLFVDNPLLADQTGEEPVYDRYTFE